MTHNDEKPRSRHNKRMFWITFICTLLRRVFRHLRSHDNRMFWITAIYTVVTAVGLLVVWQTLSATNNSLKYNVYITSTNWTLEIDKMFFANPELRPYFYEGKDIAPTDPQYQRAVSMAEMLIDSMDSVAAIGENFPDEVKFDGWKNWIMGTFSNSPLLVRHLEELRDWYQPQPIWKYYEEWKTKQKRP